MKCILFFDKNMLVDFDYIQITEYIYKRVKESLDYRFVVLDFTSHRIILLIRIQFNKCIVYIQSFPNILVFFNNM